MQPNHIGGVMVSVIALRWSVRPPMGSNQRLWRWYWLFIR